MGVSRPDGTRRWICLHEANVCVGRTVTCLREAKIRLLRTVICLREANIRLLRTAVCLREASIRLLRTVICLREAKIRLLRTVICLRGGKDSPFEDSDLWLADRLSPGQTAANAIPAPFEPRHQNSAKHIEVSLSIVDVCLTPPSIDGERRDLWNRIRKWQRNKSL
jgi:predicted RNA-binding Zn ribbon-like protein